MMDNNITKTIQITTPGELGPEQEKAIATFRQQHPEYAEGDLEIAIAGNNRSMIIRPKVDRAFTVRYYMTEPVEEEETA